MCSTGRPACPDHSRRISGQVESLYAEVLHANLRHRQMAVMTALALKASATSLIRHTETLVSGLLEPSR
jgi:hypothetical protein